MGKRVLLAVGGSGGHLFPAQALAQQLDDVEILFAGHGLSSNRFFSGERFEEVPSGGRVSWQLVEGLWMARNLLKRFRPQLVVGFGSFHAAPVIAAAVTGRVPLLLHECNAVAGRVVRWCAPWAKMTTLYFPEARVRGRSMPVQMPIRPVQLMQDALGLKEWGLEPGRLTVLVMGGSQGAKALNEQVPLGLAQCRLPLQVIHLAGDESRVAGVEALYRAAGCPARVMAFESQMDKLWSVADLAICRSGANTCAELVASGVPSILVPYPLASDRHQDANAAVLAEKAGGAMILSQEALTPARLGQAVEQISGRLGEMRGKLERYRIGMDRPTLVQVVKELLQ